MGKTLRMVSAIFPLSIFIVSAMLCTAPAFGLSATQGQTLAEVPQMTEITEGYVLSKHSDYGTDDRDYVRGDMLYVWAWSSRVNPYEYDVVEHYCQLKLDEYVHNFYLNYDQNMTLQYSYTGSFSLSRLEKTGDWDVQIFLKTKPPKPVIFSLNDVIRVSAPNVPPPLIPNELWQVAIGSLTVFGATAYVLLWRRQRHVRREIKETDYRTTLESVRLEAMLQELDNLLQKGLVSKEKYGTMRREMEDELTRIRRLKS